MLDEDLEHEELDAGPRGQLEVSEQLLANLESCIVFVDGSQARKTVADEPKNGCQDESCLVHYH